MIVTRFMSFAEWEAFERGETLENNTDHFDGGKGGSQSVGFCFTEDAPEVAWRYLKGIVDADVWVTFEFPDGSLKPSMGKYIDYSSDDGTAKSCLRREWCCTSYDNTIAKVVDKCVPFQGVEYRQIRGLIKSYKKQKTNKQSAMNKDYIYCFGFRDNGILARLCKNCHRLRPAKQASIEGVCWWFDIEYNPETGKCHRYDSK